MKKIFILFLFSSILTFAQPRLVVGIMVDGLQQTHIDQLSDRFNAGGFKKLTAGGTSFTRLVCNVISAGNASDIATITSGTLPYYHGVVSNQVYNRNTDKIESVFQDASFSGIETKLNISAKKFRTTNIVDEIMMVSQRNSKSYVIGLHAEDVIALGGHAANGVVWMDDVHMKWSSTDYYADGMPWQALDMNVNGAFHRYVDRVWQPLYPASTYIAALNKKNIKSFEYKNTSRKRINNTATILKNTPAANSLVAELALRMLQEQDLGVDRYADALMLQFTVRSPNENKMSIHTLEKEDMYLRLDIELQFLIQKIEHKVGADKVLFVLFGNQTNSYSPEELKENNIHAGYFNANRSMALLSSYLMAIYGQEKWISGYYGKNIYLNKKLIEEKGVDFRQMQEVAIEFMLEFEGVQSAYRYSQLMNSGADPGTDMAKIRNSTHKSTAGDIILSLMPGWLEVDDHENPVGESNTLISYLPVWFYGANIPQQRITKQHQITDIAPTISKLLNIPYPNANIGEAIILTP